jgi:hypothetical protein
MASYPVFPIVTAVRTSNATKNKLEITPLWCGAELIKHMDIFVFTFIYFSLVSVTPFQAVRTLYYDWFNKNSAKLQNMKSSILFCQSVS